tara:strand:+ start:79 stop:642 length:564 start_codon:yes stop_codon:yes gene_type:complete
MKSPFYFIVKPLQGKRYTNTKQIEGVDFVTSSSQEDHKFSNRKAKVIETPLKYKGPIKVGDTLLVHHNVFKFYYDMKGREKSGKSYFKDDLFFVDNDQFFMYKQKGVWHSHDRYCFVEPIDKEESFLFKRFKEEPLMGKMKYSNKYLISKGVLPGMKISFKPDSEYEFKVGNQKLYRMFDHQIILLL